jgi:DNA-binding MarR family transcriptional regulator
MRADLVLFPARALEDESLTRGCLKVLHAIGRRAKRMQGHPQEGWAWPSLVQMEEDTGLSRPTIIAALRRLEQGSYLRIRRSRYADGRSGPNYYYILLDDTRAHVEDAEPFEVPEGGKADFTTEKMGVKNEGEGGKVSADLGVKSASDAETPQPPAAATGYPAGLTKADFTGTGRERGNKNEEAAAAADSLNYLRTCVTAANTGMRENPAIGPGHMGMIAGNQDHHLEWIKDGIPAAAAAAAILERARTLKLPGRSKPPASLAYFDGCVRDAFERIEYDTGTAGPRLSEAERIAAELRGEA